MKRNSVKNRLLCILLAVLTLAAVVLPLSAFAASDINKDFSIVKVKLSIGNVTENTVTVDGNYYIGETGEVLTRGKHKVTLYNGTLTLTNPLGEILYTSASGITLKQGAPTSGRNNYLTTSITAGSYNYFGDFKYTAYNGYLRLVNHVYMEDYVVGVISYEMGESFPLEALKAQAIVARSYAANHKGTNYDVVDTTANQVYRGYSASFTKCIAAAQATKHMLLFCNDELATAYYAASNGGFIEMPQHAFGSSSANEPYYVCKPDPYDTANSVSSKETLTIYKNIADGTPSTKLTNYLKDLTLAALADKEGFAAELWADITLKTINSITPKTLRSGHTTSMDSYPNCGNHASSDFAGSTLENCGNYSVYTVKMTVSAKTTEGDYKDVTVSVPFDVTVIEPGGKYAVFTKTSLKMTTVSEYSNRFTFNHVRFGHGIGMSQRGAQQAANEGLNYAQIIAFYYPNTQIKEANIIKPALVEVSSGGVAIPKPTMVREGYCLGDSVNVRSGAGTSYSKVGSIAIGEKIEVIEENINGGEWHRIWYKDAEAYVHGMYFVLYGSKKECVASAYIRSDVNFRTAPTTTNSVIISNLASNTPIFIIKEFYNDSWHKVLVGDKVGYINNGFVEIEPPTPPTQISLPYTWCITDIGKTLDLTPTAKPDKAVGFALDWQSTDTSVCTVDENGLVTAVAAGYSNIICSYSDSVTDKQTVYVRLETPASVKAVRYSENEVTVSWQAVKGASSYEVYRSDALEGEYTLVGTSKTASFMDTAAADATAYYYKVKAKNAYKGCTSNSSAAANTVTGLSAVTGLKVTEEAGNSVKLSWNKVYGSTAYEIYRSKTGNAGTFYKIGTLAKTSCTSTGLTPEKTYYYKVRAINENTSKKGAFSAVVSGTPAPQTPEITSLKLYSIEKVNLKWTSETGVTGYQVYYKAEGGSYKQMIDKATTSMLSSKLTPQKTYYFKVRSYYKTADKTYYSAFSPENSIKMTVDSPKITEAVRYNARKAQLNWQSVQFAEGYQVYYKAENGEYKRMIDKAETSMITVQLDPGTNYYFKVRAYYTHNGVKTYGDFGAEYKYKLEIPTPTIETLTAGGNYTANISWSAQKYVTGYEIYSKLGAQEYKRHWSTVKTGVTLVNLTPAVPYKFKVRAYYLLDGQRVYGEFSAEQQLTLDMGITKEITSERYSERKTRLNWAAVDKASGYQVYYRTEIDEDKLMIDKAETTMLSSNLTPGGDYWFKVRAYVLLDGVKYFGDFCEEFYVDMDPDLGRNMVLSRYSDNQLKISWDKTPHVTGYQLNFTYNDGSFFNIETTETTLITPEIAPNDYTVRIRTYIDYDGKRCYSVYNCTTKVSTLPDKSEIKELKRYSEQKIQLKWEEVKYATGYEVAYKKEDDTSYKLMIDKEGLSMISSKLTVGETYLFKVRAYRTFNGVKYYGKYSDPVTVEIDVKTPTITSLTKYSDEKIKLVWSEEEGVTGYRVYYKADGGTYKQMIDKDGTSMVSSKLTAGVKYYFKVRSYILIDDKYYFSDFSEEWSYTL